MRFIKNVYWVIIFFAVGSDNLYAAAAGKVAPAYPDFEFIHAIEESAGLPSNLCEHVIAPYCGVPAIGVRKLWSIVLQSCYLTSVVHKMSKEEIAIIAKTGSVTHLNRAKGWVLKEQHFSFPRAVDNISSLSNNRLVVDFMRKSELGVIDLKDDRSRIKQLVKHDCGLVKWLVSVSGPQGKELVVAGKDGRFSVLDTKTWQKKELLKDSPQSDAMFSNTSTRAVINGRVIFDACDVEIEGLKWWCVYDPYRQELLRRENKKGCADSHIAVCGKRLMVMDYAASGGAEPNNVSLCDVDKKFNMKVKANLSLQEEPRVVAPLVAGAAILKKNGSVTIIDEDGKETSPLPIENVCHIATLDRTELVTISRNHRSGAQISLWRTSSYADWKKQARAMRGRRRTGKKS